MALEKGNRKGKSQKHHKDQLPQPKAERKAVITITPDNVEERMDIQTGNVSDLEIIQALRIAVKHFARKVIEDAEEVVGDNEQDINRYIDWRIEQSGING